MTEQQKEAIRQAQKAVTAALESGAHPDKVMDSIIQTAIEVERRRPRVVEPPPNPHSTIPSLTRSIG